MKQLFGLIAVLLFTIPAGGMMIQDQSQTDQQYKVVGEEFPTDHILSAYQAQEAYNDHKSRHSFKLTFKATVNSVCERKGCWMKIALENGCEVKVRFKEFGFFVPQDMEGDHVVVNGMAYVAEVSVEGQRHYAEDEGTSLEAVAAIDNPKRTLTLLAEGVQIY